MPEIVLVTANARFSHCSLALRLLRANLRDLRENAQILEFTIKSDVYDCAEQILALEPRLVAVSISIWNVDFSRLLLETLRRVAPNLILLAGGPEIQRDLATKHPSIDRLLDHAMVGEGEIRLRELCEYYRDHGWRRATEGASDAKRKLIVAEPCKLSDIIDGYGEYTDEDIAHRVIYVESSRGCPYRCAFCLSANERGVRYFDEATFHEQLETLYQRGVRNFKFLDRTLNAHLGRALRLLAFFIPKKDDGLRLHFEMVPHEIPQRLLDALAAFPPGCIQIEFGVQTLNAEVAKRIHRPLDAERLCQNLARLVRETGTHIHADLIAGLPGEDLVSFAASFDRLLATGVEEIQVGILKRLSGSPLARMAAEWQLEFSPDPPYEILRSADLSFAELRQIHHFSRFFNATINSGNFPKSGQYLLHADGARGAFDNFYDFTAWIRARYQTTQGVSHTRWIEIIHRYLCERHRYDPQEIALRLLEDFVATQRNHIPPFLKPYVPADFNFGNFTPRGTPKGHQSHKRQQKRAHLP